MSFLCGAITGFSSHLIVVESNHVHEFAIRYSTHAGTINDGCFLMRLKVPTTKTELIVQELHLLWSPGDVEFPQAHWLTLTSESGVDSH